MKYILTSYLVMIASLLYSCTDSPENNAANKSAQHTAKHLAGDTGNLISFEEIKILVAKYSGKAKNNRGGMSIVTGAHESWKELKPRVVVD